VRPVSHIWLETRLLIVLSLAYSKVVQKQSMLLCCFTEAIKYIILYDLMLGFNLFSRHVEVPKQKGWVLKFSYITVVLIVYIKVFKIEKLLLCLTWDISQG
jgi:hypothetical protein